MQARKEVALRNDRVTLDDVVGELIQSVQQLFVLLDY
jgi:hypothetical protein